MTRRIVAAILLSVWTTLITGGAAAYWGVRSVLLDELDRAIVERAAAVLRSSGQVADFAAPLQDRYLIADEQGQTIKRMPIAVSVADSPQVLFRTFTTLGGGERLRTLTLAAGGAPAGPKGNDEQPRYKVVYSTPADGFDRTLSRLAWMLVLGGAAAGVFTAAVAGGVARRALKPLRNATDIIRRIDVHHLDQRLDADPLPPELRPVATTLNEMLAALEQAVEQRQQFLADASHELRTPIAALVTSLEVSLSRPRSESESRTTRQRCLANVNALRQLVDHLLEQVRSEQASGHETLEEVDVLATLTQLTTQIEPLAQQRGVEVHVTCDEALRVMTQPHRFRSIVMNLVGNAVEHHHGAGWVRVEAVASNDDLVLTVSDDGPGIALEHQSRIFEPFYRVDSSRESAQGHLGLGLSLVQINVRALGGSLELQSEPGQGTTFRMKLPQCVRVQHEGAAVSLAT